MNSWITFCLKRNRKLVIWSHKRGEGESEMEDRARNEPEMRPETRCRFNEGAQQALLNRLLSAALGMTGDGNFQREKCKTESDNGIGCSYR